MGGVRCCFCCCVLHRKLLTHRQDQTLHSWCLINHSVPLHQVKSSPYMMATALSALGGINMTLVLSAFLFYFIGGYLLYGALFAAIGSASESDADAQQFMLPVTAPLIISIISLSLVLQDPHGSVSFGMSIMPFTSPIIMMMRIPFGVAPWELIFSMFMLILGFLFTLGPTRCKILPIPLK